MDPETGLLTPFNDDQADAVKDALDKEGFDDGYSNQTLARTEIISYCNIYDGVASSNEDDPITEAIKE